MATEQQSNKNNNEEVDLGALFTIIGNGIKSVFTFIGSVFKGGFNALILILLFLRENFKILGVITLIGFSIGLFFQITIPTRYSGEMLVKPNFNSSNQLYKTIYYFNELVKQKDTLALQEELNITKEEAASLKKFFIQPEASESDLLKSFSNFVKETDSTTVNSYSFEEYKNNFPIYKYSIHRLFIESEKKDIFKKLEDVIINKASDNDYLKGVKEITKRNLKRTDSIYKQNLKQVDSLRQVYMNVLLSESKKEASGTNIDLGSQKGDNKEIMLFETNQRINSQLEEVILEKSEKSEIIIVVSGFQPVGVKIAGFTKNRAVQFGALGFLGAVLILLLLKLNRFLANYKPSN